MSKLPKRLFACLQYLIILLLAIGSFLVVSILSGERPVQALPEYTTRIGEPCAACHVNPGGGGPRTLRGLLWAARGRPDAVPHLPGVLLAPGVMDGAELYDLACAGCHGLDGEGLFAMGLVERGISKTALHSFIVDGIPLLGMPGFEGQFDEDQLDSLVNYLAGLGSGEIEPRPAGFILPPAYMGCDPLLVDSCEGGR
jgi:mono/diheme cytochrome c family protein